MTQDPEGESSLIMSLECKGANRATLLENPVIISIEKDKRGRRLIGCPFIKGLKISARTIIYFCEANSPSLETVIDEAIRPETTSEEDLHRIQENLPRCFQKYPV